MGWNPHTVEKGRIGEEIVDQWLISHGYIPYRAFVGGAHPFDRLVASADKRTIFVAEVKAKPARVSYPDTGIDVRHYNDYTHIGKNYNLRVFLAFVDEDSARIYGGFLDAISRPHVGTSKNGKVTIAYPSRHTGQNGREIIYFPLALMSHIATLTPEQVAALKKNSTRKAVYTQQAKIITLDTV